ncbi:MAG TPA: amidohydrolase family protein [Planctomycetaceae bacterium]|nr:amidohydrolase family protein [Planctomycetaceae bacterium]
MNRPCNRRQFFETTAAAACAGILLPSAAAFAVRADEKTGKKGAGATANQEKKSGNSDAQAALQIVDTHEHLWDLTKFNLAWAKDDKILGRSFVNKDYLEATKGLNVVKSVYMEVDVDPSQQMQEADYVIDLCQRKDNPMVGAVISGRPASTEFEAYITKHKDSPFIKGVRQVLHGPSTPAGFCLDRQFVKSVQLLGELGMSFDLCLRSGELADGDKLVAQCPRTRFVVDHCGNMSVQETDQKARRVWADGMKALAQRDNVVCKISGIIASAGKDWKVADLEPNMRFSMETFGPERRMFAGDWPVCTLRASFKEWVLALKEIVRNMNMPIADQKKLFHDNAVKFYGLKEKGYRT